MKVFLTSVYQSGSYVNPALQQIRESAAMDAHKVHEVVSDPDNADIIIFTELHPPADPYFFRVRKSAIYKKYKNKCYLYHDNDMHLSLMPTISPSVELKTFAPGFDAPFSYIFQFHSNPYLKYPEVKPEKNYLFSFIGSSRTHAIRSKILQLNYSGAYLHDSYNNSWDLTGNTQDVYYKTYADICLQSKFILCPKGIGPGSYRLFESLEMGLVPVIISDDWIAPDGPNWDDFSICIAEAAIKEIPQILKNREMDADKMGKLAREAWLNWFAKGKQFHQLTEACIKLHNSRNKTTASTYLRQYLRFLEPYHFKNLLRYYKNRI